MATGATTLFWYILCCLVVGFIMGVGGFLVFYGEQKRKRLRKERAAAARARSGASGDGEGAPSQPDGEPSSEGTGSEGTGFE